MKNTQIPQRTLLTLLVFMLCLSGLGSANKEVIPASAAFDPTEAKKAQERLNKAGHAYTHAIEQLKEREQVLTQQCKLGASGFTPENCALGTNIVNQKNMQHKIAAVAHFTMAKVYEIYALLMTKAPSAKNEVALRALMETACEPVISKKNNPPQTPSKICLSTLEDIKAGLTTDKYSPRLTQYFGQVENAGLTEEEARKALRLAREQNAGQQKAEGYSNERTMEELIRLHMA
ncbi:MAG: hypothetical protein NTU49_05055 [Gammaproteobacteria bacterium]|nr:hypothetical protein [Gammaproteobacteria bacterium]